MKHYLPIGESEKVEVSAKQLEQMLSEAYQEGYVKGQIDQILNNAPDFAMAEDRQEQKKKKFSENGKVFIFRATII